MDETLSINVDNASFRGNEAVQLEARRVNISAKTHIHLNTTVGSPWRKGALQKDGSIHLSGRVFVGDVANGLPLSPSPALSGKTSMTQISFQPPSTLFVSASAEAPTQSCS